MIHIQRSVHAEILLRCGRADADVAGTSNPETLCGRISIIKGKATIRVEAETKVIRRVVEIHKAKEVARVVPGEGGLPHSVDSEPKVVVA